MAFPAYYYYCDLQAPQNISVAPASISSVRPWTYVSVMFGSDGHPCVPFQSINIDQLISAPRLCQPAAKGSGLSGGPVKKISSKIQSLMPEDRCSENRCQAKKQLLHAWMMEVMWIDELEL